MQAQMETLEGEGKDDNTLREIQKILYSTEVRHPPFLFTGQFFDLFFSPSGRIRGS